MPFLTLTDDEQIDVIIQTYKASEMDLFVHQTNKARFAAMLLALSPGVWRTKIETLLTDTNSRLVEVQSVLDATTSQLPAPADITASLARLAAKEAAAK